jgi:hypothetical protein
MGKKKQLLTDFFNELKEQVGTYRIRDIETDRSVNVFLGTRKIRKIQKKINKK